MDVRRAQLIIYCLFTSLFFLSGCKGLETSSTDLVEKAGDTCASGAVQGQYMVHWKDGSTTLAKVANQDELIQNVIEPNKNAIRFAEIDQRIRLTKPIESDVNSFAEPAPQTWGQDRTGANEAWKNGITGDGVIVAVVDSGVDLTHPQLAGQIAVNPREVVNGIDDDENGYIDDVKGWDFNRKSPDVTDGAGHGTHVAGIIAADPSLGPVKGVAPKAKILPLDFMDDDGSGFISDAVRALYYAHSRGARIINASWGGPQCSRSLREAIYDLSNRGVLFVSASGNGDEWGRGEDISSFPTFPAAFAAGLQISVGASTYSNYMAGFSNYSLRLVHLLAPGTEIFSTYPRMVAGVRTGGTKILQGTSMATPFVSAAAALLWSDRPNATAAEVRSALFNSVDVSGYPVVTGGRLNIKAAISELERSVDQRRP